MGQRGTEGRGALPQPPPTSQNLSNPSHMPSLSPLPWEGPRGGAGQPDQPESWAIPVHWARVRVGQGVVSPPTHLPSPPRPGPETSGPLQRLVGVRRVAVFSHTEAWPCTPARPHSGPGISHLSEPLCASVSPLVKWDSSHLTSERFATVERPPCLACGMHSEVEVDFLN